MARIKPHRRILFLCTGNSARSQMAEGLLRHMSGGRFECLSAGSRPAGSVHPLAVRAMRELGIDISGQHSKSIREFLPPEGDLPDVVISVCDAAATDCPTFPGNVERRLWPFDDPAAAAGSEQERLAVFRRVRDEIQRALMDYLQQCDGQDAADCS